MSTNVTTLLYSKGSFEVNLLFAKKSSTVSGSGFTVCTFIYMKGCHFIYIIALYFWNDYNTILVWSEKSKPAHSIPQSPLQTLLCSLYMKGCYLMQGIMNSVLCTFEMSNIATILSLYEVITT